MLRVSDVLELGDSLCSLVLSSLNPSIPKSLNPLSRHPASMSKHLLIAVSIPSARQSTFRIPSASMSSLSHSMNVRPGMAPFSSGTISHSGVSVMTNPPTCCERCRGKPSNCRTNRTTI